MDTENLITCSCGQQNSALAFRCSKCDQMFDGRDGHSIPLDRQVSIRQPLSGEGKRAVVMRKRRFPSVPAVSGPSPQWTPVSMEPTVAVVTYSDDAAVRVAPSKPGAVGSFVLSPDGGTNEVAGLALAADLWRQHAAQDRLNILLFSDGEANQGGYDPKQAAVEKARELKKAGARVATVGFGGTSADLDHLRTLASSPALAFETRAGSVVSAFLNASQSLSQRSGNFNGREFIVFVIDASGSMDEGNKREEVEQAVNASIGFLKTR